MDPDREVKVMAAQGLQDCKKMLMMAKAGKLNGYLLEGMACPGGCVRQRRDIAEPGSRNCCTEQVQGNCTAKIRGGIQSTKSL